MNSLKKAYLFYLIGICGVLVLFSLYHSDLGKQWRWPSFQTLKSETTVLTNDDFKTIHVETSHADVQVMQSDSLNNSYQIDTRLHDEFANQYELISADGVLTIREKEGWNWASGFSLESERINLTLPVHAMVSLSVSTRSGTVEITQWKGEDLQVNTASGTVKGNALVASHFSVITSSGDSNLEDLQGNLQMESSSGEIRIKNLAGTLNVKTTSGDVSLKEIESPAFIQTRTVSGEIKAEKVKGTLNLESTSGDMQVRQSDQLSGSSIRSVSGDVSMRVVALTSYCVIAETTSGNQNINPSAGACTSDNPITITTVSGDIEVRDE